MTFPPVFWILSATGVLGVLLIFYEKRHRRIDRRFHFFPRMVTALLFWIIPYAMELGFTGQKSMLLMANLQFVGIGSVPFLLFLTIRQFLGRAMPRRGLVILSAVIPLVTVVLAFTDPWLGLLRDSVELVYSSGMMQLHVDYGLWHNVVFVPYQYLFYLASLSVLVNAFFTAPRIFRPRLLSFIAGILIPLAGGTMYVLGIRPFDVFNPVSALIMVSFIFYGFVMLRHHYADVLPVAKDLVLDALEEGIIILDQDDRIVEFNIAASSMFSELNPSVFGTDLMESLGRYDALLMLARGVEQSDAGFSLTRSGRTRHFLGRAIPLIGFDATRIGRILAVTDITDQNAYPETTTIAMTETTTEEDTPAVSRKAFFRDATRELNRAVRFNRPLFVVSLLLPESLSTADIAGVSERISGYLNSWEIFCYSGPGQFLIIFPETDKDQVLLRVRELSRRLTDSNEKVRMGISKNYPETTETIQEISARALNAVLVSTKEIVVSR